MSYNQNLTMIRGDTKRWISTVFNYDGTVMTDLSGCSFWFTAKVLYTTTDPGVFQKTLGTGIALVPANPGNILITLLNADTVSLTNEDTMLHYDLQMKDATGNIDTLTYGTLFVMPEVTLAIA